MPTTDYALKWDETGKRFYETGVSRGVFYPGMNGAGVAWNGLTGVDESSEGGEPNALYADDTKYLNLLSNEEYKATISAYTYPDEFAECDGSAEIAPGVHIGQQNRTPFGFSYVTKIGNDVDGAEHGYKIHLIYNCLAAPSDRNYETINDNPDAITFSWEVSTTPVVVDGYKPTASLVIDSTKVDSAKLTFFERILYGTPAVAADPEHNIDAADAVPARLPLPNEVALHFAA